MRRRAALAYAEEIQGEWRHNVFFQNNTVDGRLAFTDISEAYAMDDTGWGWGCTFEDFNRDLLVDLAVANGFNRPESIDDPSRFFMNLGGRPDWFEEVSKAVGFGNFQNNTVDGRLAFTDISEAYAMDDTGWGWGCTFEDFNRDLLVDLAVANGFNRPESIDDPSRFFMNLGGRPDWFEEVSKAVGFADTDISTALVAADFDRDGDLDLAQTCGLGGPFRVLNNTITGDDAASHYLVVQPRMDGPNHFAIGAIVRATVGSTTMMRQITAGQSTQGQQPAESYFGLGNATVVNTLTIQWPDGQSTVLENVAADQVLIVTPGMDGDPCPADFDDSGAVGAGDLLLMLSAWGPNPGHPADLDRDGIVGASDLLILLANWGPCP